MRLQNLGYAMTTHKAEGLAVSADWTKPDGQQQRGTVLGYLPGMDNAGMYVAASRHKDQFVGFASREEMEAPRLVDEKGLPADAAELHARVQSALADVAERTAENANDTPVTEERMPAERPDLAAIRARARASREQREQALANRQSQEHQHERGQEPAAEQGDDVREREYARQAEAEARDRGIER